VVGSALDRAGKCKDAKYFHGRALGDPRPPNPGRFHPRTVARRTTNAGHFRRILIFPIRPDQPRRLLEHDRFKRKTFREVEGGKKSAKRRVWQLDSWSPTSAREGLDPGHLAGNGRALFPRLPRVAERARNHAGKIGLLAENWFD